MRSRPTPLVPALLAALLQAVMVLAFAWPAAHVAPREVPLAVAGPAPAAAQVVRQLNESQPGAFDLRTLPDEAAARAAVEDRDVYGAIVLAPAGQKVLTASAASPAVAQALAQFTSGQRPGTTVEDVVKADPDDPRGTGFAAMVLPLVMAGIAASVLLTLLIPSPRARLLGVAAFAVAAGILTPLVAQTWLSLTPGTYLEVAGVTALASLAVAAPITGLAALIGPPGIGVGALTLLLLGNPLSGAATGPELLPRPWGAFGQFLQPGAAASLLRSATFFDGAAAARPLLTLLAWSLLGLSLLTAALLKKRPSPEPPSVPGPEPVVLTA